MNIFELATLFSTIIVKITLGNILLQVLKFWVLILIYQWKHQGDLLPGKICHFLEPLGLKCTLITLIPDQHQRLPSTCVISTRFPLPSNGWDDASDPDQSCHPAPAWRACYYCTPRFWFLDLFVGLDSKGTIPPPYPVHSHPTPQYLLSTFLSFSFFFSWG